MEDQPKIMENVDQSPFISNAQTVSHQPDKFVIDFKLVFQQYTPDNKPYHISNHKVILLDPFGAKEFLMVLQENVNNYEKTFGEIKKPESIEKAEKIAKANQEKQETTGTKADYLG